MVKLQEMEGWRDDTDLPWYDSLLSWVSDAVRNEILVGSSVMMERLMEDHTLIERLKFVSQTLLSFVRNNDDPEGRSPDWEELNEHLHSQIRDLISIDDEFDRFAARVQSSMVTSAVSSETLQERNFRKGPLSLQVPHHRKHPPAKIVKSSSGSPSPIQRQRPIQSSKTSKKVRWSEVLPGNDSSSMMLDEDQPQSMHSTVWPPSTNNYEEDVSMQDAPDPPVLQTHNIMGINEDAVKRESSAPRKMSLTATALVRSK